MTNGKWVFPNGTVFEGNFKHNKPEGDGIFVINIYRICMIIIFYNIKIGMWHFKNGNNLNGIYKQTVN